MNKLFLFLIIFLLCQKTTLTAQMSLDALQKNTSDSTKVMQDALTHERDLVDVFHWLANKRKHKHLDKPKTKTEAVHFAFVPGGGYSLQTGVAVAFAANTVFYTNKNDETRQSTVQTSIAFTQKKQIIVPLAANIWSKNGNYNFISDIRYMNYPSATFGLGARSRIKNESDIDFNYLRFHQSVLRKMTPNLFAGVGIYYDRFWKIQELNPTVGTTTSFERYGLTPSETATGINLQAVFDNRENPVNATQGWYVSARFRTNKTAFGSNANWDQTILEIKKYLPLSKNSRHVLALWSYNWFTTAGKPPYLMLPSTGWDDFFNIGRGYLQGRYRAQNMSYLEAEYRFPITHNGLFGGVVFANAQTFSKNINQQYQSLIPGYGLGLRLKLNKHSATNLCVDYGWGKDGSGGVFVNLGEVF